MSSPSILIVEDEAIVSADISIKLRKLGYEVAGETNTGEKAAQLALKKPLSLILMDIHLAGAMDGITAADIIRKECQIPVVFLTALTDKATIKRALHADAFGYIMKPFDDRELHTQIEMALYKHAADRRLRESELRLREVLENSLDVSYKLNLQTGVYDYLSPVIFQITGYTSEQMKTFSIETLIELIHPDDQAEVERIFSKSKSDEAGSAYHMEYRFRHKKGQYIWLHNQFTIMRDARGQPLASIGVVRDITQGKHNEEQRTKLISDLQKALSEVKTLQGLLPICAHCKNIRDDKGYWSKIESYIHKHSGADFTHGICPECANKYYPDMGLFVDKQN